MENIFENAKHLDAFLTKNGHKAILVYTTNDNDYDLWVEGCYSSFSYKANGKRYVRQFGDEYDIVSKYKEPIDEDKLNELAKEFIKQNSDGIHQLRATTSFKAGYRKAMEEL